MSTSVYPGDEKFQELLNDYNFSMSAPQIRLYLAGLFLGPKTISPENALEEVLLSINDKKIDFFSEEEKDQFMDMFLALWSEVETIHESMNSFPKLGALRKSFRDRSDKIEYILDRGDDLAAFYLGLEDSHAGEIFDQCFELLMAELALSMMNELFGDFFEANETNEKATDEEIAEMLTVVEDLFKTWPSTYTELKQVFSGIEAGEIKLLSEEELEQKMEEFKSSIEEEGESASKLRQ